MKLFHILSAIFLCIFSQKIHAQSQQLETKANVGKWQNHKKPTVQIPFTNPNWIDPEVKIIGTCPRLNQYYGILSKLKNVPSKHTWPNGSHFVRDNNLIFIISADSSMCCVLTSVRPPYVESINFFFDPQSPLVKKYVVKNGDFWDVKFDMAILFIENQLYGEKESK